jgi:hypothetical protein
VNDLRRFLVLVGAVGIVTGGAACGGGGGEPETYTLDATRACLEDAGYTTAPLPNPSLPAAGGHLRVQLTSADEPLDPSKRSARSSGGEYVFIVFASDPAGAVATRKKAVDLAEESLKAAGLFMARRSVSQGIGLTKNVLFYSTEGALTQDQRTAITSCLR